MPKNCTLVLSSTVERFSSVDPGESGLGLTHTAPQWSDLRNSFIQEEIIFRSPRIWVVPLPYTKASVPCFPVPALAPCRIASRLPRPAQTCSPPYYMCSFACSLPADCTRRDWEHIFRYTYYSDSYTPFLYMTLLPQAYRQASVFVHSVQSCEHFRFLSRQPFEFTPTNKQIG